MDKGNQGRLKSLVTALKAYPLKFYLLVAFLFFIIPLNISLGEDQATLTVINKTEHFMHMYVNGAPHLYVAPLHKVRVASGSLTFTVTAFYAPGQGVSGAIDRTFEAAYSPPPTTSSGCWNESEGSNAGCTCSEATGPAQYGDVVWEVTADTMLVTGR